MNSVTNELILEHLKRIHHDVREVKELRSETREGFACMRQHIHAVNADIALLERRMSSVEEDVALIKRRLEIVE
jgi:hypothetical protein